MMEECSCQFLPGGASIYIPVLFHPSVETPRSDSYFNLVGDLPDTNSFSFRSDSRRRPPQIISRSSELQLCPGCPRSHWSVRGICGHVMLALEMRLGCRECFLQGQ